MTGEGNVYMMIVFLFLHFTFHSLFILSNQVIFSCIYLYISYCIYQFINLEMLFVEKVQ